MRGRHRRAGALAVCLLGWAVASMQARTADQDRRLARDSSAAGGHRVALVIGNNAYRDARLQNAVADARAVAAALKELGFDVTLLEDVTRARLTTAIVDFEERLRSDDLALLYFAGHGVQIGGENYLLPIDFAANSGNAARLSALAASDVQQVLAKARVSLLVLDACRNNPYGGQRGSTGLAAMEARGSLVAFATGAGQTASDNPGAANGLFTQELLKALSEADVSARNVFYRVRQRVFEASNGRQFPALYDGLLGDFVLRPAGKPTTTGVTPIVAAAPGSGVDTAEVALWNAIEKSSHPSDYEVYLSKYPNGVFAELAKSRLADLKPRNNADSPTSSTPPVDEGTRRESEEQKQKEWADVSRSGRTVKVGVFDHNNKDGSPTFVEGQLTVSGAGVSLAKSDRKYNFRLACSEIRDLGITGWDKGKIMGVHLHGLFMVVIEGSRFSNNTGGSTLYELIEGVCQIVPGSQRPF